MSTIDIQHAHSLSDDKARTAIAEVAEKLQERFDVATRWDGPVLHFNRSGVDGHIEIGKDDLHVSAKLGFLTAMFKEPIESEIKRVLKEKF